MTETTDALIIGAGPTGMALSIALHQAGTDHVLIDRLDQGQNTSRAAVIHAQTLESLHTLGVAKQLEDLGLKLTRFTIRDRDRALLRLRFDELPSRYRHLLMLPQNVAEQVLADRLAALGGGIRRGVTATGIVQDKDGVRVTVNEGGMERIIAARYVVGADGMHSIVRDATGVAFDGAAYADSFVLADIHMDWPLGRGEVSLFFSPEGLVVVAPLPDGSFRIVATMEDAPELPSIADIQALIDARGPRGTRAVARDVVWSSRFRVHHRLARSYRQGRLILMGDAAHVHSPAGGQGMNTGMIDAIVLGQLLADVVKGARPEEALDLYGELRRPAAEEVLTLSGRLTAMATMRNPLRQFVRNLALSAINLVPSARRRMEMNLSGLARASLAVLPASSPAQTAAAPQMRPSARRTASRIHA
ncbi:FAD-dependent oxidoreductase [Pseudorhodoplanes sp.]|uniref:FAD-dependent oxidoreductase n=1 Tax=Pseudorhodoplanes sp. TaxID=1934341 RepID=UPI003D0DF8F7